MIYPLPHLTLVIRRCVQQDDRLQASGLTPMVTDMNVRDDGEAEGKYL